MPTELLVEDSVIAGIKQKLEVLQNTLGGMESRREKAASSVVTDGGQVRSTFANEVASRDIEIQAIKKRIQELQADLEAAKLDFPRRLELRQKAETLELEARGKEKEALALQSKLRDLEEEIEEIRNEKNSILEKASHTLKELEASVKNLEEVRRLNREDRLIGATSGLREAQLSLEKAMSFGNVPDKDLEFLRKRVAIYQRKVDELKET
jgi:predicted  nucleic acid-binding Zn-ribbon protein